MNVLIVNAYGTSNRGDAALLKECIRDIQAVYQLPSIHVALFEGGLGRYADDSVVSTQRIGNYDSAFPLRRVQSVWFMLMALAYAVSGLRLFARCMPQGQAATVDTMRKTDLVVSAPGGYIHDTNFAYVIALFHIWLGSVLRKPVVLAPQSVGPIRSGLGRFLSRRVLSKAAAICAREGYSARYLETEIGLPRSILRRTGDSAFWGKAERLPASTIEHELASIGLTPGERFLGLTVVDWSFPGHSDPIGAKVAYREAMVRIIDHVCSATGLSAVIFNQVADDLGLGLAVQGACQARVLVDQEDREPDSLRELIGRSTIFLGTRFHSCIFALMESCPTFAIAYLPKTEYIMRDLEMSDRFTDIANVEVDRVVTALVEFARHHDEQKIRVAGLVDDYRRTRDSFADVLSRDARK